MVVGLTGNFGTGKTFVAGVFRSLGAKVCDADAIAHRVIRKNSPAHKRIVAVFGKEVLGARGEIDRSKLGRAAFADKALLKKLNAIVHPRVIREIKVFIRKAPRGSIVVIDAPLLIEAGLDKITDKLVVVGCSKRRQIERCAKKFRLKKREILQRVKRQMPLSRKMKMADFPIENSGTRLATKKQVIKVWGEMSWK